MQSCLNISPVWHDVCQTAELHNGFLIIYKTHSPNCSVINTHLEAKMKPFTALLLLSVLAAYVSSSEMAFHRAVFDFLDEQHDERMAQALRDQGFSEDGLVARDHPEPPKWMVSKHLLFLYSQSSPSQSPVVSRAKATPA